jgi:hypothetical protein
MDRSALHVRSPPTGLGFAVAVVAHNITTLHTKTMAALRLGLITLAPITATPPHIHPLGCGDYQTQTLSIKS